MAPSQQARGEDLDTVVADLRPDPREGESIPLYEDGDITRDFVYIGDLAREIARYHSAPEPHITGQYRDGDVRHVSCGRGHREAAGLIPVWDAHGPTGRVAVGFRP